MAKIKAETLLRKIQKQGGAIINKEKSTANSFNFNSSRIEIFRKREIVKPYLHSIDSRVINEQVDSSVKKAFIGKDPKLIENLKKFLPTHLINDIYSMYYNRQGRLEFEGENKTNKTKFKILDSINNSLIKIVTNNSHIGSYVYTEEIGKFLYEKFMTMTPKEQEELQKSFEQTNQENSDVKQQEGEGEGKGKGEDKPNDKKSKDEKSDKGEPQTGQIEADGTGEDEVNYDTGSSAQGPANNSNGKNTERDNSQDALDKMLDGMLNSKKAQEDLEKAFEQAEKKLDKLKELGINHENAEDLPENEKNEIIANLNNLDKIRAELQKLNVSKDKVLKAVEKILNGTTNYFSKKCITNDVELFEAEQLLDINGLEFLHPMFKNSRIFDLSITERKYIGKNKFGNLNFDLYIYAN